MITMMDRFRLMVCRDGDGGGSGDGAGVGGPDGAGGIGGPGDNAAGGNSAGPGSTSSGEVGGSSGGGASSAGGSSPDGYSTNPDDYDPNDLDPFGGRSPPGTLDSLGPDIDVGFAPGVNSTASISPASTQAAIDAHDIATGPLGTLAGWLGFDMVGYSQPDETTGTPEMGFDIDFDPLGGLGSLAAGMIAGPIGGLAVGLGRAARGFANEDNVDVAHGFGQIASAVTGVPGLGSLAGRATESAMGYNDFDMSDVSEDDGAPSGSSSSSPSGAASGASGATATGPAGTTDSGGNGDGVDGPAKQLDTTTGEVADGASDPEPSIAGYTLSELIAMSSLGRSASRNPMTGLQEFSSPMRFDANPYVSGDRQGNFTNDQAGQWWRNMGYTGDFANAGAINWGQGQGLLDDYEQAIGWGGQSYAPTSMPSPTPQGSPQPNQQASGPFSGNPFSVGGRQGSRTDAEAGDWFRALGYGGEFQDGAALNWAAANGYLDDYAGFISGGGSGSVWDGYPRVGSGWSGLTLVPIGQMGGAAPGAGAPTALRSGYAAADRGGVTSGMMPASVLSQFLGGGYGSQFASALPTNSFYNPLGQASGSTLSQLLGRAA